MRVRYLVTPGYVVSQHDRDRHWISASEVARLYGLRPGEWQPWNGKATRWRGIPVLRPRSDGDYTLPEEEK